MTQTEIRNCKHHGETEYVKYEYQSWRCRKCLVVSVNKRRRKVIDTLYKEHGNKCAKCGYNKNSGAFHFHHRDPSTKKFRVGFGDTYNIATMREEAEKCDLLCANCHAEVEYPHLSLA